MSNQPPNDSEEHEEEHEEGHDAELHEDTGTDEFEESDFGEDEEEEEIGDGEDEDEEEELGEEESEVEDLEEEHASQEKWPPPPEKRPPPEPESKAVDAEEAPEEKTLSIGETPLTIIVEAGRLQVSIQKLMELQPGNMLNLNLHPENGVDLVVNGRRIAKGELVLIGEALGVRILDIG